MRARSGRKRQGASEHGIPVFQSRDAKASFETHALNIVCSVAIGDAKQLSDYFSRCALNTFCPRLHMSLKCRCSVHHCPHTFKYCPPSNLWVANTHMQLVGHLLLQVEVIGINRRAQYGRKPVRRVPPTVLYMVPVWASGPVRPAARCPRPVRLRRVLVVRMCMETVVIVLMPVRPSRRGRWVVG